jgi:hypothetical protein
MQSKTKQTNKQKQCTQSEKQNKMRCNAMQSNGSRLKSEKKKKKKSNAVNQSTNP